MLSEKAQNGYLSAILQSREVPEKFVPVMAGILSRSYFNDEAGCMEIVTNTYVKKGIAKKIGMKSPSQINSGLTKFEEAKLVRCVESGVYRMNPEFFGNRAWAEVQKIKIEHCFSRESIDIHIIFEYADGQIVLEEDTAFWDPLPVDVSENEEEDDPAPEDSSINEEEKDPVPENASDMSEKEKDPVDNEEFPPVDIPDDLDDFLNGEFPDCTSPFMGASNFDMPPEFEK